MLKNWLASLPNLERDEKFCGKIVPRDTVRLKVELRGKMSKFLKSYLFQFNKGEIKWISKFPSVWTTRFSPLLIVHNSH